MIINLYIKEDGDNIEEDSLSITLVRKNKERSQSINVKRLDDLTAIEQQTMRAVMAIIEKYRGEDQGAKDMKYGL